MSEPAIRFPDRILDAFPEPVDPESLPGAGGPLRFAAVAAVLAAGGGITIGLTNTAGPVTIGAVILAGAVAVGAGVFAFIRTAQRAQARELQTLAGRRISATTSLGGGLRKRAFESIKPLKASMQGGSSGLKLYGEAVLDGVEVRFFKHQYTTGGQNNTRTVTTWVAVTPGGAGWPNVTLSDENMMTRFFSTIGSKLGKGELQLEDPTFNDRFHIRAKDRDFAVLALGPEVQRTLTDQAKGRTWVFDRGFFAAMAVGGLQPNDVRWLGDAAVEVRRALPEELVWYNASDV